MPLTAMPNEYKVTGVPPRMLAEKQHVIRRDPVIAGLGPKKVLGTSPPAIVSSSVHHCPIEVLPDHEK